MQVEGEWELLNKPAETAQAAVPPAVIPSPSANTAPESEATPMETDALLAEPNTELATQAEAQPAEEAGSLTPEEARLRDQRQKLASIMRGETSVQLYLEFLHSHNHADLQVCEKAGDYEPCLGSLMLPVALVVEAITFCEPCRIHVLFCSSFHVPF